MVTEEKVTQSGQPSQMLLYQMATSHYVPRALHLAAKLGIADQLKDGARHFSELAQATATHARSLNRMMRLLASAGVFREQEDGKFALTPIGESLRTDVPGSARAMVMWFARVQNQDASMDLEYCVRTGEPAFRKSGIGDRFSKMLRDPEEAANFDAAMSDLTRLIASAVASVYDFTPFGTLVDVGGGDGTLLIGILKANPKLRGIVFDLPDVAERANKEISENALSKRCQAVSGDFFKDAPSGGDAYILKHIIHGWNDERALTILKNCRRVVPPNGKLLIIEFMYPQPIDQSLESRVTAVDDVNMLVRTGGRQRSEAEFRSLYDAAGFELTRIVPTQVMVSVIEGTCQ